MSKQQNAADAILTAINRYAMQILKLPADQREARYAMYRGIYVQSMQETGSTPEQAVEFANKVVEFTRARVKMIEEGSGAESEKA
ncbi:hypothetical protein BB934_27865 (plasmid) [Microvirga ossetica]|uniref:Uncharacterized protein n=1 Tax=Microvirga ossetica TaxID=1882682 RepID=A0A1B2EQB4_9HYPH|nr:hypothetical protein [Microvirga ossetica]ANY82176.1 hypothetical protein BB934_27865 [Microvirga ossetica]